MNDTLQELTGLPDTGECLHCYLSPLIDAWLKAHPQDATKTLTEVASVLGEMVGSALYRSDQIDCLESVIQGLSTVSLKQATELISTLQQTQPKSRQ